MCLLRYSVSTSAVKAAFEQMNQQLNPVSSCWDGDEANVSKNEPICSFRTVSVQVKFNKVCE